MKSSSLVGLLVGWVVMMAPALASAQECVSGPTVLPGISGPPKWFGTAGATDWRPELNDPRWAAATARRFVTLNSGAGTLDDALYRVLYDGGMLYVSIQMLVDPTVSAADSTDYVFFAFDKGALGNHAWAVGVRPNRDVGATPVAAPGAGVPADSPLPYDTNANTFNDWYESPDGTWAEATTVRNTGATPTWMHDIATWRQAVGGTWAITFKVDINSLGITAAAGPLHLFIGARRADAGSTVIDFGSSALAATDSATVGYSALDGAVTIIPNNRTAWTLYSPPGFGACTAGASITPSLIGVVSSGSLTNSIQACATTCPSPPLGCVVCPAAGISNTFEARVQSVPNTGLSHAVRAKFRIAEWGSTIANWQFASWRNVDGIPDTIFTDDVTTMTNPPWQWAYAAGQGTISFTCAAPANGYCPLLTNADGYKHQCMMVELASGPSANIDFSTSAAYRNMNFVGLSKSVVPATISIKGLQQVTGQAIDRDVYLYVQRRNLPDHGEKPVWLKQSSMALARRYAETPPALPGRTNPSPEGKPDKSAVKSSTKKPTANDRKTADATLQGKPTSATSVPERAAMAYPPGVFDVPTLTGEQALGTVWPTYKVFVYYDSGRTTKVRGKSFKVLEPMVPFGFHLDHEGPLYGFTHELLGLDGLAVTKLAEDYYRIRVPKEGAVRVQTTITAEEQPRDAGCPARELCEKCYKPGHCNCRLGGVAPDGLPPFAFVAAAAALLVLARRTVRRRRQRDGRE